MKLQSLQTLPLSIVKSRLPCHKPSEKLIQKARKSFHPGCGNKAGFRMAPKDTGQHERLRLVPINRARISSQYNLPARTAIPLAKPPAPPLTQPTFGSLSEKKREIPPYLRATAYLAPAKSPHPGSREGRAGGGAGAEAAPMAAPACVSPHPGQPPHPPPAPSAALPERGGRPAGVKRPPGRAARLSSRSPPPPGIPL